MSKPVWLTPRGPLILTVGGHSSNLSLWHAVNVPERDVDSVLRQAFINLSLMLSPAHSHSPVTHPAEVFQVGQRRRAVDVGEVKEQLEKKKSANGTQRAPHRLLPPTLPS